MEWWYNNSGLNLLKGVDGDPDNPLRLSDHAIVDFLRRIPEARESFNRVVPNMLEDEQIRLRGLIVGAAQTVAADPKQVEDDFQSRQNRMGVRTAGRWGGMRRGGN